METKLPGNSINDVIEYMTVLIRKEINSECVQDLVNTINEVGHGWLSTANKINIIGQFYFKAAPFKPDPVTRQQLKTVCRLLRDGRGNCVQYTIAIAATALAMGLPVILRFVSYRGQQLEHVYPIVDGVPVDIVIGQDQSGAEPLTRKIDAYATIGQELPYIASRDVQL